MSKEVSKQIEETVEAVEEVKDTATEVVAEKEPEATKSFGEKTADFIAKYRKPALRALTVTTLSALAYSIYNAAKESGQEHVLEGDFDTFDDEIDED